MAAPSLVIFDFDGTLTLDDTFISFSRHALGPRRIARGVILSLPSIIKWKAGISSSSEAKERLYHSLYKGLSRCDIGESALSFTPHYNVPILEALKRHCETGDEVWIISASLDLWLKPIARQLGVGLICTETETDSRGRLTGRFATPNCRGEEKLRRFAATVPDYASRHITLYADEIIHGGDSSLAAIASRVIEVKK